MRELIPRRREVDELLRLAAPVTTVQVGMMLMGVVDTIMVGHVSSVDLAAVALGNLYFFTAVVFGLGTLLALDPVVSQAVGAHDEDGVARGLQRGILLAGLLSVGACLALVPAPWVLSLLDQPREVVPVAAGYAHAALPGVLPFYLFVVLRQTLQAMGRVAPIVWTVALANVANVGFNWVLVYGNLGMPALGAVGAGWASSLSRGCMAVGVLIAAAPALFPYLRAIHPGAFRLGPVGRMIAIGAPIGVQFSLEFGAFAAVGILMGWLGTTAMAGHQVAINLASLTFMVAVGVAQATTVLVGRAVGRNDAPGARRAAGGGLLLGVAVMTATALLFLALPGPLARIYTSEAGVLAVAVLLIPVAGVFQIFDGIQVVATAILRGVGDTRAPMIIHILGFWTVGLPVALWVGFARDGGAVGLWWGLVAGLASVAALLLLRVRRRFAGEFARLAVD